MKKQKILTDHKRTGKRLVPPFVHMIGPLQEVSWIKTVIPEILWIGLIQTFHGHRKGVDLITSIARSARAIWPNAQSRIFGATSAYKELSEKAWEQLRERLVETGELFLIQEALRPLAVYYPESPFINLFSSSPGEQSAKYLQIVKQHVEGMYDRTDYATTMVQATFVWLAFDADVLKVFQGLALAKFPQIEEYPKTELSQQFAASVRVTVNMFFGSKEHYPGPYPWPSYFWNRGLAIDQCEFAYGN